NITKFGAFVNILPGRDGLLHISKIGKGKRIDKVEDVLELGQEIEVTVDEVDPNGKVSLSLAGEAPAPKEGGSDAATGGGSGGDREFVSFEDEFEDEAAATFGTLGPEGGSGGGRGGGGGGGRGGRGRRR
ncbi:MAG: S1 RNA-binding domain-containing protein, partial [Nocardioidaceae bacterium]|nr:S1 RNA-binding domain-containing protein [Nocardioidaceae bacterium]